MTISSALNAGVAGLNANAVRLATISDNIANAATYGYKRAEADFHAMVLNTNTGGTYTAGGVRTTTLRLIDERGPLVATANATDIAINGRGFLPVTTAGSSAETPALMLVTTGSFRPDAAGVLTTPGGQVLLGWPARIDGTIPDYPRHSVTGLEPVRITANQFVANPTTAVRLQVNLPATATMAGASGESLPLPVEYFGNLGTSEVLAISFIPDVPATGASNEWRMVIRNSASGNAVKGEYVLTFDGTQGAGGTLASVTPVSGGAYDPATGTLALSVAGGPIALNIGRLSEAGGLTQLSDSFTPIVIDRNGAPVGNLASVEVDAQGFLHAIYDTGFSRILYQIPVLDVPNPNGLIALGNQAFQVSPASGGFFLWNAGEGPVGAMAGYAREQSATDVAAELTQLIQTQRAYSSNARVIQTVDEMLQETANLKR